MNIDKTKKVCCELSMCIFGNRYIYSVFTFFMAIILPLSISYKELGEEKDLRLFWALVTQQNFLKWLAVYIVFSLAFYYCTNKKKEYEKLAVYKSLAVDKLTNIIRTICQAYNSNETNEKTEIFDATAQSVCTAIYEIFMEAEKDSQVRVSVIKQILDRDKHKFTMPGFKSKNTEAGITKATSFDKSDKYFKQIFKSESDQYYILNEEEIQKYFKYDKSKSEAKKPKSYIGLPCKGGDSDAICFLLQVDSNTINRFGKDKEKVENFINSFIWHLAQILKLAYVFDHSSEKCEIITYGKEVNNGKQIQLSYYPQQGEGVQVLF